MADESFAIYKAEILARGVDLVRRRLLEQLGMVPKQTTDVDPEEHERQVRKVVEDLRQVTSVRAKRVSAGDVFDAIDALLGELAVPKASRDA
jgi:hypothetical protein